MYPRTLGIISFLLMLAVSPVSLAVSPTELAGQIAAAKIAGQELDRVLSGAIGQVDQATANRIRQLRIELDGLIQEFGKLEKETAIDANELIDEALRSAHSITHELRTISNGLSGQLSNTVNNGVTGLLVAVDGLPLSNVQPYVGAISPQRILPNASNRTVKVLGYFGRSIEGHPIEFMANGSSVKGVRAPGGYQIELPPLMKEETYVPLVVKYPTESGWWLWKKVSYQEIADRIYVEKAKPFTCAVKIFEPNPAKKKELRGAELTFWAATEGGRGKPQETASVSAKDLFIQSIAPAEHSKYQIDTVVLTNVITREAHNQPCEHVNTSHEFNWNTKSISYTIRAPNISPHQHSGMNQECRDLGLLGRHCIYVPYYYIHGGGGSWRNLYVNPIFNVSVAGIPDSLMSKEVNDIALSKNAVTEINLPSASGSVVHVSCSFKDGDEQFQQGPIVINQMDKEERATNVLSRLSSGKLFIGTIY